MRALAGALAVLELCLTGSGARADTASPPAHEVQGTVLAIEPDDVVVDLGSARGASDGAEVEIWRPLRVRHPVTGQILTDRFLIGRLRLAQVRTTLALATTVGAKLSRAPATGDIVILAIPAGVEPAPAPTTAPQPLPGTPAPTPAPSVAPAPGAGVDPETKELLDLFDSLRGADIETRVRKYEAYVYAHPHARYVRAVWDEAKEMRKLLMRPGQAVASTGGGEGGGKEKVGFAAVSRTDAGWPLRVAVELPPRYVGAVLHSRRADDPTYVSEPMAPAGPGYWAATIPVDRTVPPRVDYFIEGVGPDGTVRPLVGDAASPEAANVEDMRPGPPRKLLATASILTDYASFNGTKGNDYVWQTEGMMSLRLGDEGLRAVRSGFGVYRGVGGTLDEIDRLGLTRSVGLTYGYLEGEYGFSPIYGLAVRAIVGLREDGVNGGAQAFFRVGNDRKTNLLIGGEVLGGIGIRGITELQWNTFPRVPIILRSEVTNQPAGVALSNATPGEAAGQGEIGVRAIVQVGYRITPGLIVSVRGSYQGRTIDHAGPGGGGAVAYEW